MAEITITIDEKQQQAILDKLKAIEPNRRGPIFLKAFRQSVEVVNRKLKTNVTGPILSRRTGHLAQSIESNISYDGDDLMAEIGSGVANKFRMPYANIHEDGGVITPKKAKYLTIPLEAALTRAGVPKKASARDWANTFIRKSKGGNLIIFQAAKSGKIIPLYVLKRSVSIPGRQYLSRTVLQMRERFLMAMNGAIQRGIDNE